MFYLLADSRQSWPPPHQRGFLCLGMTDFARRRQFPFAGLLHADGLMDGRGDVNPGRSAAPRGRISRVLWVIPPEPFDQGIMSIPFSIQEEGIKHHIYDQGDQNLGT